MKIVSAVFVRVSLTVRSILRATDRGPACVLMRPPRGRGGFGRGTQGFKSIQMIHERDLFPSLGV